MAVALLSTLLVQAAPGVEPGSHGPREPQPGDYARYSVFQAVRNGTVLQPSGPASPLEVTVLLAEGSLAFRAEGSLAFRLQGEPAGPGSNVFYQSLGQTIGWRSTVHTEAGRADRVLHAPATVIPHCIVVRSGPCGVEPAPAPERWLASPAWSDGTPHGLATQELVRTWGAAPFPTLLAAASGSVWTVFELEDSRSVTLESVEAPPPAPPTLGLAEATPWLFDDRNPGPKLPVPLSDAYQRAQDVPAWQEFWSTHPDGKITAIQAPHAHLLLEETAVRWVMRVEDNHEAWLVQLLDEPIPTYRLPADTEPLAPFIDEWLPDRPPAVTFTSVPPSGRTAPARLPNLREASAAWSATFDVPSDVRYSFYEHASTGPGGPGLTFVGGSWIDWSRERFDELLGGILVDEQGNVVGSSTIVKNSETPPNQPRLTQGKASPVDYPAPRQAFWWTGLATALWLGRLPALALFAKVRKGVLNNPTRAAIVAEVRRQPGIALADLARTIEAPHARIQYHLRILRVSQLVDIESRQGRTRLFPFSMPSSERNTACSGYRSAASRLRDEIERQPCLTTVDLAQRVGLTVPAAARILRADADAGKVLRMPGRPARWTLKGTAPGAADQPS